MTTEGHGEDLSYVTDIEDVYYFKFKPKVNMTLTGAEFETNNTATTARLMDASNTLIESKALSSDAFSGMSQELTADTEYHLGVWKGGSSYSLYDTTSYDYETTNFLWINAARVGNTTNRNKISSVISLTFTIASTGTNIQINIGDSWKEVDKAQINIGDTWKEVAAAKVNIGDTWKTIF